MPSTSHPFASPNAIPPRTSSTGILNGNSINHRSSVLRPLTEVDWMSQSKKSKTSHSSESLNAHLQHQRDNSEQQIQRPYTMSAQPNGTQNGATLEASTNYPTPISPSPEHSKDIGEDLIYGNGVAWREDKERILTGPYDYLEAHPGKDIRSQCIAAFNLWLKVPEERLEVITRVVGMLHTASLLYVHITSHQTPNFK